MDKIKQKKELIFFDNTGYQYGLNKYKELSTLNEIFSNLEIGNKISQWKQ